MNQLQKYFRYRQALIDQYLKGDMTKREYLQANYDAVIGNDFGPFTILDSVEKCLFNYQYYNALAKENRSISIHEEMELPLKRQYQSQSDYYYRKKDQATQKALELLDYRDVEAYFVKVKSRALKGKLFEIVCHSAAMYDMILHSTNDRLRQRLEEEGVFSQGSRVSLIDAYVNQRY